MLSGCASWLSSPVIEAERSGEKYVWKAKDFSVEFPQGSKGPITLQKFAEFRVPAEGDLLSGAIPEGIGSYTGLSSQFWRFFMGEEAISPDILIRSYPLLEPVTLDSGIALSGSPAPENYFLARLSWNASWTDTSIWGKTRRQISHGEPGIREREIGGKKFHEIFVTYGKPSPPTKPVRQYLHLRKDRAYSLSFGGGMPPEVEQAVLESFTPADVQRTREDMLLERALLLWTYRAISPCLSLVDPRTGFAFGCVPFNGCVYRETISEALHDVLQENPENYLAHLCLGIHHISARLRSFQPGDGLPEHVRKKEATLIEPRNDFDHYAFNPIWVYDRRYISAYLLRGDFDVKAAVEEFESALRARPSSYAARYFLSWLYARTGEYDKAVATLREMERIVPGYRDARLLLVGIYQITGKQAEGKAMQEELYRDLSRRSLFDELAKILGPALGEAIGTAITGGFR